MLNFPGVLLYSLLVQGFVQTRSQRHNQTWYADSRPSRVPSTSVRSHCVLCDRVPGHHCPCLTRSQGTSDHHTSVPQTVFARSATIARFCHARFCVSNSCLRQLALPSRQGHGRLPHDREPGHARILVWVASAIVCALRLLTHDLAHESFLDSLTPITWMKVGH